MKTAIVIYPTRPCFSSFEESAQWTQARPAPPSLSSYSRANYFYTSSCFSPLPYDVFFFYVLCLNLV